MAKWKNGNGPALWPIDMSQISKVLFVAIPQTDTHSTLAEAEIEQEYSGIPECPIHFKTDTIINILIYFKFSFIFFCKFKKSYCFISFFP